MKFVLKVLVLGFLIVASKWAKTQTVAMEKPMNNVVKSSRSFVPNTEQASVLSVNRTSGAIKM